MLAGLKAEYIDSGFAIRSRLADSPASCAGEKRRREKAGRKSDAIELYQSRKADAVAGHKLPELRNSKVAAVGELIDDALEFVANHKDNRNYNSKAGIVREVMGSRSAVEVTLQEMDSWF